MDAFEGEPPAAARGLCKVPSFRKAYDSDVIRDALRGMNASAVIPPRSNRSVQYGYDRHVYKERHVVENFFQRIKRYRKLATRYAKRIELYCGAIALVAVMDWLR